MDLTAQIKKLPHAPGVYVMKDARGEIMYVGKAADLYKRVRSYLRPVTEKTALMMKRVRSVSCIPTRDEAEALIYEASLIRSAKPHFNIDLKDDKSYPLLRVTVNEPFPRLMITRRVADDGALYFGPYTDAGLLREAVSFLRRVFPLRTCANMPARVCLNHHIGQCPGPCAGGVAEQEYRRVVEELVLFLRGEKDRLLTELRERMEQAAARQAFEEARELRDRIRALSIAPIRRGRMSFPDAAGELSGILGGGGCVNVIEGFDISTCGGSSPVGSMVRFVAGKPDRQGYRRFIIKKAPHLDDCRMLEEVLTRRYGRVLREQSTLPDVVLVDGGRGQLSAACAVWQRLGLRVPLIAIAKEKELLYLPGVARPLALPAHSALLRLIQRVRDEAHRYAVSFHRLRRSARFFRSRLDRIAGIGPVTKKVLVSHFGGIDAIRAASREELARIKGVGDHRAGLIVAGMRHEH